MLTAAFWAAEPFPRSCLASSLPLECAPRLSRRPPSRRTEPPGAPLGPRPRPPHTHQAPCGPVPTSVTCVDPAPYGAWGPPQAPWRDAHLRSALSNQLLLVACTHGTWPPGGDAVLRLCVLKWGGGR